MCNGSRKEEERKKSRDYSKKWWLQNFSNPKTEVDILIQENSKNPKKSTPGYITNCQKSKMVKKTILKIKATCYEQDYV